MQWLLQGFGLQYDHPQSALKLDTMAATHSLCLQRVAIQPACQHGSRLAIMGIYDSSAMRCVGLLWERVTRLWNTARSIGALGQ